MNGYEIKKKLDNCKVYAKSFSGVKIKCMEDYAQPAIRINPDNAIIIIIIITLLKIGKIYSLIYTN